MQPAGYRRRALITDGRRPIQPHPIPQSPKGETEHDLPSRPEAAAVSVIVDSVVSLLERYWIWRWRRRATEDRDEHWFSDEHLEAQAAYDKATEQIEKWSQHPDSAFARDQLGMWREIQSANAWWQPGAPGGRTELNDAERAEFAPPPESPEQTEA